MMKRLEFALEYQHDAFENVIYSDESTVQLETHRRYSCCKEGEAPQPKPRYVLYATVCLTLEKKYYYAQLKR